MLNSEQLQKALEGLPADRITREYIESRIERIEYLILDDRSTLCTITIDNGFRVRGISACAAPENFNQLIGEKVAYDDAFKELWAPFGFMLVEKLHQEKQQ